MSAARCSDSPSASAPPRAQPPVGGCCCRRRNSSPRRVATRSQPPVAGSGRAPVLRIAALAVVGLWARRSLAVVGGGDLMRPWRVVVTVATRRARVLIASSEQQVGGRRSFALDLDRAARSELVLLSQLFVGPLRDLAC